MSGISAAQDAVDRGEWRVALDALDATGAEADGAVGLELRATAHYGDGDFEAGFRQCIGRFEGLFGERRGDPAESGA